MKEDSGRALEAVLKLTALEERTAELKQTLARIERKIEKMVERLAKVEANYEHLRRSSELREILGEERPDPEAPRDSLGGEYLVTTSEE